MTELVTTEEMQTGRTFYLFFPGIEPPQTVEDAVKMRAIMRERVKDHPGLFALFGFRVQRKQRAARSTDGLRSPTKADDEQALALLAEGATVYEAQEFFRDKGIGMTHNRMCQLGGARP